MENNYSMLFPCPPSSSYTIPSSSLNNGQSSNAFLGLKPSDSNMDHHHHDDDEDHVKEDEASVKKKGEKKAKKPKYAFQTRSQVDILDDGYRWRKYGQKAVKNNKFPRSYYRCTHQGCNVKKQVQRLTKDEGVVVTTYEGVHTHPIEKTTDNFEHILSQMQIYTPF
ncbi:probable WRKY transcription factor 75 [Vicia villosa]|uniref:probable WRKY transcription factor 75 n=1 Tax=Vicia villosa TaxID=3911 RepID=UPI00273B3334|nr:probable WRKY transcription factor 75 [Vicia villosa]